MDAEQTVRAFCAAHHIAMLPDSYRPSDLRAFLVGTLAAMIKESLPTAFDVDSTDILPAIPAEVAAGLVRGRKKLVGTAATAKDA